MTFVSLDVSSWQSLPCCSCLSRHQWLSCHVFLPLSSSLSPFSSGSFVFFVKFGICNDYDLKYFCRSQLNQTDTNQLSLRFWPSRHPCDLDFILSGLQHCIRRAVQHSQWAEMRDAIWNCQRTAMQHSPRAAVHNSERAAMHNSQWTRVQYSEWTTVHHRPGHSEWAGKKIPHKTSNSLLTQVCNTVSEQQCNTVQEEQCSTVQEQQCSTQNEQQCNTINEEKCETQYMEKYEQQCSTVNEQVTNSKVF